jgi:hypothetical protein
MWLFGKKVTSLQPGDVSRGEMTARYDVNSKHWAFRSDGVEFNLSGIPFNELAFDWAKDVLAVIRSLDDQIRARVRECLESWPCDKTKAEILSVSVDLDKFLESKTLKVAFVGDESWGDFGVEVIITDGRIVDVYGGD